MQNFIKTILDKLAALLQAGNTKKCPRCGLDRMDKEKLVHSAHLRYAEVYIKTVLDKLSALQQAGNIANCPRCGQDRMDKEKLIYNAYSRRAEIYICSHCGEEEALGPSLPLAEWDAVVQSIKGETFLDLLRSGTELDCDLIIGGADMPASFYWDDNCRITDYGVQMFKPIMVAPYTKLPNGNIEVHCDSYELGEMFVFAAAGYIGNSVYEKIFGSDTNEEEEKC